MRNYYLPGRWNVICDVCGFKFKSDQVKFRWDGKLVCDKDYETRHPSDLIRVPTDNPSVPWSRPELTVSGPYCNYINSQGIAGVAVAGCAMAGNQLP